ncbi:MAG TPA: MarR family transcriptional regulator [Pseudonocardiaceae bacterium]|nr:MarR family transcriptional regulator [Pseudonocardiaceae bacterium]
MTDNQGPRYDIGPLLRRAHRKAANAFTEAMRPLDLQGKHFGVLLALHRNGPLSQRGLIDSIDSDKSSMVRMIDDLEARGLCARTPDDVDRRAYKVRLTDAGRAAFDQAERTAFAVADELLAGFAPDESRQFYELLLRFVTD